MASYILIFSAWLIQFHYGDGPPDATAQLQPKPRVQMKAVSPNMVSALQQEVAQLKAKVQKLESVIHISPGKVEIKTDKQMLFEISAPTVKIKSGMTLDIQGGAKAQIRAGVIMLN